MHKRVVFAIFSMIAGSLACTLPGATPTANQPALATGVSATLTALAPMAAEGTPTASSAPEPSQAAPTASAPPMQPQTGLQIVYIDGGNVWLLSGDQPARQLTNGGDAYRALISDDGQQIVYLRRDPQDSHPVEIRTVGRDGQGDRSLFAPAQFDALYPLKSFVHNDLNSIVFLPGTHTLMLNTQGIAEGPGLAKYDDLLTLDADTGALRTLFAPGEGGDFAISPDGARLAIVRPDSISLANADGSGLRATLIRYTPVTTYSEYQYYAQPVWSPDSTTLGVVIPSPDPLAPNPTGTVWKVSADGGQPSQVGRLSGDFFFIQTGVAPSLSPSMAWVAFLQGGGGSSPPDLHLIHPDGSGEVVIPGANARWEGWSPGSDHFAYSAGGPPALFVGELGSTPFQIGQGQNLRWLSDDAYLYLAGTTGDWTLRTGTVRGGSRVLASPAGDFINYDFALP